MERQRYGSCLLAKGGIKGRHSMFLHLCPFHLLSKKQPDPVPWSTEMTDLTPSRCSHVSAIDGITFQDIHSKRKETCYKCNYSKNIRWLCLQPGCLVVGCGKKISDHSTSHFEETGHPIHLSLSKWKVYCNLCKDEVQPDCNVPGWKLGEKLLSGSTLERLKTGLTVDGPFSEPTHSKKQGSISKPTVDPSLISVAPATPIGGEFQLPSPLMQRLATSGVGVLEDEGSSSRGSLLTARPYREREYPKAVLESAEEEMDDENPTGLTGLKNLGNTCYMNAALQNLSNCSPLSEYFQAFPVDPNPQPTALAVAFKVLIDQIWSQSRPGCVPPYKFLGQVRNAFPAFRGWGQQDSQEFLRCFLDQLHQEMKEPVVLDFTQEEEEEEESGNQASGDSSSQRSGSSCSESISSEPDLYETADSGCSSELEGMRSPRGGKRRNHGYRLRSQSDSMGESFEDANDRDSDTPSPRKTRSSTNSSPQQSSQGVTKKKPMRYRSIITDIFDGKLASRVQCLTCNHISETKETFQDLSLPIPSTEQLDSLRSKTTGGSSVGSVGDIGVYSSQESLSPTSGMKQGWLGWMWSGLTGIPMYMYDWWRGPDISLQDCLSAFFLPDDLRGDDMYSCEKCKKLRNGVKCCRLLSLPEVLCVHLKRFRHELMYSSKVSTRVRFPMDNLDLRPFADKKCSGEVSNYELTGIITHYGGAEGGHYVAYCRNPQNMKWYEFDDSFVTEVSPAQVLTSEAYVLFYQKIDKNIWKVREEAERLMAISQQMKTRRAIKFYISQKWLKRLATFAEPGPITNSDFLCPHGGIDPRKVADLPDRYAEIPDTVWKFLHSKFRGGPSCNTLVHCLVCQQEVLRLERKRMEELKTYKMLEKEASDPGTPRDLYDFRLLSGRWFEQWDMFISGSRDVPGAIDNRPLLIDRHGKMYLRQHARWHRVSRDMWEYFYGVYGGGPEVYPTNQPQPTPEEIQAEAEARAEARLKMEALAQERLRIQRAKELERQRRETKEMEEEDQLMDVDRTQRNENSSSGEEELGNNNMTREQGPLSDEQDVPMDSPKASISNGIVTRSRSSSASSASL